MGTLAIASTLIAFAGVQWSGDSVTSSIYTMHPDGSHRARLTAKGSWTDTNPDWSRDGRRIAFGRMTPKGWRIYVMNASGGGLRGITSMRPLAESPSWSPNGRSIAFAGLPAKLPMNGTTSQQVYVVGAAGGRVRKLTNANAGAGAPAWSPDGGRIAFAAWPRLADNVQPDVWTIRPDGSGARRVVRNGASPAWSPDGKRIAFARNGDIYTVAADGSGLRRITNTPKLGDQEPSWSAAGLVFSSMRRARDQRDDDMLITIASGSRTHTISDGNPDFWMDQPAWRP